MDEATISKLAEAPIEFIGQVAAPGGGASIILKASELDAFCADPEAFFALRSGALKEEYRQWVETEGTPRCGASTTKGTRCGNIVSGGIQMSLERWLQEDGGFCTVHGGPTSAQSRHKK